MTLAIQIDCHTADKYNTSLGTVVAFPFAIVVFSTSIVAWRLSPEEQDTLTSIHDYIQVNRCDEAHNIPIPVSSGEEEVEEDLYSQASPLISCDSGDSD